MSRLSKRMTRKPRAASWRQKSSSQWIIWAPSPMISSSGSAAGVAEDFVADVDAVGAGDLRRLMGEHHVLSSLEWYLSWVTLWHGFPHRRRLRRRRLTGPPQRCGMGQKQAKRGKRS